MLDLYKFEGANRRIDSTAFSMSDSVTIDYTSVQSLHSIPPTARSLYLILPVCIYEDNLKGGHFFYESRHVHIFNGLLKLLEEAPGVEELHISLSHKVLVSYVDKDGIHVGYDKYGPLYEDYEWSMETDKLNPSHCLSLQSKEHCETLKETLQQVKTLRKWSCFEVPEHYPEGCGTDEDIDTLYSIVDELR